MGTTRPKKLKYWHDRRNRDTRTASDTAPSFALQPGYSQQQYQAQEFLKAVSVMVRSLEQSTMMEIQANKQATLEGKMESLEERTATTMRVYLQQRQQAEYQCDKLKSDANLTAQTYSLNMYGSMESDLAKKAHADMYMQLTTQAQAQLELKLETIAKGEVQLEKNADKKRKAIEQQIKMLHDEERRRHEHMETERAELEEETKKYEVVDSDESTLSEIEGEYNREVVDSDEPTLSEIEGEYNRSPSPPIPSPPPPASPSPSPAF
eukprot:m.221409 g.221409  ORF g.221409 m.221409 type:complete len:265 (-) comp15927_c0_seq5:42-836(-)